MDGNQAEKKALADFFAIFHDGGVEALADFRGKLVDLVALEDFDGFACGVQDHFAVAAFAQVKFDLDARFDGDGFVDYIVEDCEELSAGHASAPSPFGAAAACAIAGAFLPK